MEHNFLHNVPLDYYVFFLCKTCCAFFCQNIPVPSPPPTFCCEPYVVHLKQLFFFQYILLLLCKIFPVPLYNISCSLLFFFFFLFVLNDFSNPHYHLCIIHHHRILSITFYCKISCKSVSRVNAFNKAHTHCQAPFQTIPMNKMVSFASSQVG